jgi:hypothetical protein
MFTWPFRSYAEIAELLVLADCVARNRGADYAIGHGLLPQVYAIFLLRWLEIETCVCFWLFFFHGSSFLQLAALLLGLSVCCFNSHWLVGYLRPFGQSTHLTNTKQTKKSKPHYRCNETKFLSRIDLDILWNLLYQWFFVRSLVGAPLWQ